VRVAVAGSSGLIGTALVAHLRAGGHEVLRLVRRSPAAPDERGWDPPAGRIDPGTFDHVDAVVNLNGIPVADRPWSGARRQALRDSRVVPTEVLSRAVVEHGVPTLLNGSAVGYYGDKGGVSVDESAPTGSGFLAELARDWEAATAVARDGGVRVAMLRTGLVLAPSGGLLGPLKLVYKSALGGRIGPGTQYMPWISLDDEVGAITFLLENDVEGPVNLTGPRPVTNAEFTAAFARAVHRPAALAVPAFVIRALGSQAEEMLLFGQRAVPAKLEAAGYRFRHSTVEEALAAALGSA
jgi:hypothetical protein